MMCHRDINFGFCKVNHYTVLMCLHSFTFIDMRLFFLPTKSKF